MHGRDQLGHRMAWALSQIFVVAINDASEDIANERWLAFYGIFVRSAFGNFRDIMAAISRDGRRAPIARRRAKASIVQQLNMQGGSLRDIDVNCAGIAAGAVVQVGTKLFKHVHWICEQGRFFVNETTATVADIDVLLTGGRLAGSKATVQKALR